MHLFQFCTCKHAKGVSLTPGNALTSCYSKPRKLWNDAVVSDVHRFDHSHTHYEVRVPDMRITSHVAQAGIYVHTLANNNNNLQVCQPMLGTY